MSTSFNKFAKTNIHLSSNKEMLMVNLNFPNSVVKARIRFFARYDVRNVRLKYVYLQPCSQGFIWIISKLLFYKTNFVLRF